MKPKIVCIVGPTGVGKTALAFEIAKKYKGDLVSADAVQVFRTLDIISGKDLPDGYTFDAGYYSSDSGPSIYLLDVVEPTDQFTVSDFYNQAIKDIDYIHQKGQLPIVVGGTGLYVESLLNGLKPITPPDLELRKQLENLSIEELQNKLPKEIINSLNESDIKNKRRLIRRIEVLENGLPTTHYSLPPNLDCLVIGLKCDREVLKERIDKRVEQRVKNGALEEAKMLFENYENLTQQVKDANGYKQLFAFLKGDFDIEEALYRWKISEYRHAKNQMTWFRKYGGVEWFDIRDNKFKQKIYDSIKSFLAF